MFTTLCSADSTFKAVLSFARSNGTVIDVGAHGGNEIRYALAGGATRVIGVECFPPAYSTLYKMFWNDERVNLISGCAAADHGLMELNLAVDSSSLIKDNTENHEGARRKRPQGKDRKSLFVQTIKLDDVLRNVNNIALIKIDVQGAEYMVLEGLKHILTSQQPIVLYEYYFDKEEKPLKMLKGMGYECQMACKEEKGCPDKVCVHSSYKPIDKTFVKG